MSKRVAIIGAGPAGLTAAYLLGKENQEVRQSNLLGGLSQSCQECGYRRRSQNKND